MVDVNPTTETWPDLPPIVDERGYQACRAYIRSLVDRGITDDERTEHGSLLQKLRRACELYEKRVQPSLFGCTLVIQPCDCGVCGECEQRARLRAAEFRLQKGRERIAELETKLREAGHEIAQMASEWSKEVGALQADIVRRTAMIADWHKLADERSAELVRVMQERDALKVALETTLVNQGAGTSPYARSQPSDACEIEMWKAHAEGAWEDEKRALDEVEAWRKAWGAFGPQTPAEVAIFEQVGKRVERETAAHERKFRDRLAKRIDLLGKRLHVKRAEAAHWRSLYSNRVKRCLRCRKDFS